MKLGVFRNHVPTTLRFVGRDGERSGADLSRAARFVAETLTPSRQSLLLDTTDRFWVSAALLGAWSRRRVVRLGGAPTNQSVLRDLGSGSKISSNDFDDSAKRAEGRFADLVFDAATPLVEVETSGTTGQPRLHPKSAGQLLGETAALDEMLALAPNARLAATVPPHHLYGLLFSVLVPLRAGVTVVRDTPFHPPDVLRALDDFAVTDFVSTPAHLQSILSNAPPPLTIRRTISSAAPLEVNLARAWETTSKAPLLDVLGSSETGGMATRRTVATVRWTPLPGVTVSTNSEGRLVVESPFAKTPPSPVLTEERAIVHEDGTFEYLGRSDRVVKVGGKRVHLEDVEAHCRMLPGVDEVVAVAHDVGGLRGTEIWLVVASRDLTANGVKATLLEKVPGPLVPRRIRVVHALPRNERGKLPVDSLKALFSNSADPGGSMPPHEPGIPSPSRVSTRFREEHFVRDAQSARLELTIPNDYVRFVGHFEGDPLLPAVAQLHDLLLPLARRAFPRLGPLRGLRRLKLTAPLRPGARLSIEARITGSDSLAFIIRTGDVTAASGRLLFDSNPDGAP